MPPEQHDSPDGAQNTGSSDATQNTGSASAPQPSSRGAPIEDPQLIFDQGYKVGLERALKKLGFSKKLGEAIQQADALRNPQTPEPVAHPATAPEDVDVSAHPKFQEIAQGYSKLEHELSETRKEREKAAELVARYKSQADVARLQAFRAAALSKGVGAGKQLEAFVALHAPHVAFDEERNLQVLKRNSFTDEMEPALQSVDEFIDDALSEENDGRWFLAPKAQPGAGSEVRPVRNDANVRDEATANRDGLLESLGFKGGSADKIDRLYKKVVDG